MKALTLLGVQRRAGPNVLAGITASGSALISDVIWRFGCRHAAATARPRNAGNDTLELGMNRQGSKALARIVARVRTDGSAQ